MGHKFNNYVRNSKKINLNLPQDENLYLSLREDVKTLSELIKPQLIPDEDDIIYLFSMVNGILLEYFRENKVNFEEQEVFEIEINEIFRNYIKLNTKLDNIKQVSQILQSITLKILMLSNIPCTKSTNSKIISETIMIANKQENLPVKSDWVFE